MCWASVDEPSEDLGPSDQVNDFHVNNVNMAINLYDPHQHVRWTTLAIHTDNQADTKDPAIHLTQEQQTQMTYLIHILLDPVLRTG
ncbi:hypothetical protein Pst134EB_018608 [Puccinia striiformis f. sp. tritici]|nr:hypothetical protein Pst134EB_018608 [Puccinia striiformis f. sp. tritici]